MVIFRESTSQNRSVTPQEQRTVNLWKSRQQIRHLGRIQLILGHKDFPQSFPTDPFRAFLTVVSSLRPSRIPPTRPISLSGSHESTGFGEITVERPGTLEPELSRSIFWRRVADAGRSAGVRMGPVVSALFETPRRWASS